MRAQASSPAIRRTGAVCYRIAVSDRSEATVADTCEFGSKRAAGVRSEYVSLSLRQINEFYEALQDAFTPFTFERMLYFQLNEKKSRFDGDGNFPTLLFRTIQAANSEGWWQPLVHAAFKANSTNEKLISFLRKYPEYDPGPREGKRALLEARMAALLEEQRLAAQQPDRSGGIKAGSQAAEVWEEIQQVDKELSLLQAATVEGRRRADWREHLPKINFKEAVEITQELILGCDSRCGALFLLPNSLSMGGEWCVARIRDMLGDWTQDFKHYPIEFTYRSQLDEESILSHIAHYLDVEPRPDDLDEYSRSIIRKICGSVQSGSIVFIELRGWELFYHMPDILRWFVDSFWVPLVRELPAIALESARVKFVVMVVSDLPVGELPPAYTCGRHEFDNEKVLELPLQKWSRDEIKEWLQYFSGWKAQDIEELAGTIYASSSRGLPALVYKALDKHLSAER